MNYFKLCFIAFVLMACNTQKKMDQEPPMNMKTAITLNGKWEIISLLNKDLQHSTTTLVVIDQENNSLNATIGCNMHRSSLTIKDTSFITSNTIATEKYCMDLMETEKQLQQVLNDVRHYKLEKENLLLLDERGSLLMILTR